ncbi:hypothetical protein QZJ86_08330 [Methylomonas montana]|nr:hypothetical protein [Methylomonas montana]WKJ92133.1 hypothetical protein QZJ86_08330 [Methylomonas montana]
MAKTDTWEMGRTAISNIRIAAREDDSGLPMANTTPFEIPEFG